MCVCVFLSYAIVLYTNSQDFDSRFFKTAVTAVVKKSTGMELVQQIQAKQAEAPKADKGEKKKAKQATSQSLPPLHPERSTV